MNWKLSRLTALAVFLTLPAAAPLGAATAADDFFATFEGGDLDFSLDELAANDAAGPGAKVLSVSQPVHGSLDCAGDRCLYRSPPGFTGTDRFTYTLGVEPATAVAAEVRVQVAPLVQPFAGDWNGDGVTDLGWFHGSFLDFFYLELTDLFTDPARPGLTHSCDRPPVDPRRSGWVPFAGDWDGDGWSEIGLFDPAAREYVLYQRGFLPGQWVERVVFTHPAPGRGGLPVAGDWDGVDGDQVGLFLPEEHRYLLLSANAPGAAVSEVILTDLTDEAWLPVAGQWGGDGTGVAVVAAWNPVQRVLRLPPDNSTGPTAPGQDYSQEDPGLVPFSGAWGHGVSIGFHDSGAGAHGSLTFVLYPCDFDLPCPGVVGGRTTILLPPPDDPIIVSPCAASQL